MPVPSANIRSSSYYVAETQAQCAQCGQYCRVLGLALPPNHETLDEGEWQRVEANAFIFHIAGLPDAVSRHLLEHAAEFHRTCGDDPSESFWANHCPHCASVFSDDELHCEPGGFMPGDAQEAQDISLFAIAEPFRAVAAGYAGDPEFFELIAKR